MSAADNIRNANCALSDINMLIVSEAMYDGDGDSDSDLVTLRAAQKLVTDYISATAAEVGSEGDLEAIAEDTMNALIRQAYYSSPY